MKKKDEQYENIVIDSTVSLARAFTPGGAAAAAIDKALENCTLVHSSETLAELKKKLLETREFDRFASQEARTKVFESLREQSTIVPLTHKAEVCRDPADNMFISLALSSGAKQIITYDKDLLTLGEHNGIAMRSPEQFLKRERELDKVREVLKRAPENETVMQMLDRQARECGEAELKIRVENTQEMTRKLELRPHERLFRKPDDDQR